MENKEEHDGLLDIALDWQNSLEAHQQAVVRYLKQVADKQGYMRATAETNDILRSAYQIASRNGVEVNWETFTAKLKDILEKQHKVMYPVSQAHDAINRLKKQY